ncbi:MAG: DUF86 domain-containing protein [Leptospiraceae bacterium]|nr:DUF86 domain-containing protein [Leptospiraceae bacterium]
MKGNPSDKLRIEHALGAISEIESFVSGKDYEAYNSDSMLKSACMHQLAIIGDAFANINKKTKEEYSSVDWKGFIGLRIRVVHVYFDIDYRLVWEIIQNELPELKNQLLEIYNSYLV